MVGTNFDDDVESFFRLRFRWECESALQDRARAICSGDVGETQVEKFVDQLFTARLAFALPD